MKVEAPNSLVKKIIIYNQDDSCQTVYQPENFQLLDPFSNVPFEALRVSDDLKDCVEKVLAVLGGTNSACKSNNKYTERFRTDFQASRGEDFLGRPTLVSLSFGFLRRDEEVNGTHISLGEHDYHIYPNHIGIYQVVHRKMVSGEVPFWEDELMRERFITAGDIPLLEYAIRYF